MVWTNVAVPVRRFNRGLIRKGPVPASQVIWVNCSWRSPVSGLLPIEMLSVGTRICRSGIVTWYAAPEALADVATKMIGATTTATTAISNVAGRRNHAEYDPRRFRDAVTMAA